MRSTIKARDWGTEKGHKAPSQPAPQGPAPHHQTASDAAVYLEGGRRCLKLGLCSGGGRRGGGGPEGALTGDTGLLLAWGGDRNPGGGHEEGQVRLVVWSTL